MTDPFADAFGPPSPRVQRKVTRTLNEWMVRFIQLAPFVVLASSDDSGRLDASPRGGPPGFVAVLDETRLLVPDLSGNRLFQTMRNVRAHGGVALLFLIPGVNETARVNGAARVVLRGDDEWAELVLGRLANPERYIGGLVVEVLEAYYHCGRAAKFSDLWDVERITRHRADRPLPKRPIERSGEP